MEGRERASERARERESETLLYLSLCGSGPEAQLFGLASIKPEPSNPEERVRVRVCVCVCVHCVCEREREYYHGIPQRGSIHGSRALTGSAYDAHI